ncbi:BTAD domain-containing putative transcriptional regulator [Streptomyces sp. NBC_00198]|uniref:BTAD domain-containing putative transcriptional regulator n=1 Tax=Streptomyces sp. NBC_00198 TaxID=2975677 RepID=UPI0022520D4D|nr:BTAD domain-containing putative transcriptional regulator [Streptomyces sp. NBC_00198]MCX5284257.1 winged helix-turn-helix domain-containing protein [Streptomyces sp. NBC_00198]
MRYRILGVTQVEDDRGALVTVGGPRVRALLTALARHPARTTSPDTLIDEVWGDDPPQDAPAALQALVGRLRRAIGKDAVTSEPGGYRLSATRDDVDLHVFERLVAEGSTALDQGDASTAATRLREALALWRGPALADLPDRTAATRPEALRLEATRSRVEADLRLGRAAEVVPELKGLTADHPYDEALHVLLIRALHEAGRGADALAAYEEVRRALAEGLGTDPGPELRSLHAALLDQGDAAGRQDVRLGSGGASAAGAVAGLGLADPSRERRTGNIRPRLNSFVGREPEVGAIRSDVQRARLVTLTGPGGSGKTRLAEEAAAGLPQAWLVELAPLDRPEAVPGAVVSALGLRETALITNEMTTAQADPVALLVEYCAPRSQLLVLDNCEHVIGAAAELAETLLTRCPGLTILATSREPLGVPGELVRPVEPLLPDSARRLFLERAAVVRPDAATALPDLVAVDEICRRLDGLPLAIELAAARLRLLTPRQIADRLDDRFRLLTSGSRTVLPRQQTLRAVVDWSWDLLDERERTVLREASVFAGGWDLAAAEAVFTGSAADLVGALVDKSLVVATPYDSQDRDGGEGGVGGQDSGAGGRAGFDGGDGGPSAPGGRGGDSAAAGPGAGMRYRLLETIHEYAGERATEVPELRAAAERRHRGWARSLVEEAEPRLRSGDQLPWVRRLETELDNIRAALHRSLVAQDEEEAGALVLAIGWFWWLRNFRTEGMEWMDLVLKLGAWLDTTTGGRAHENACDAILSELESVDPVASFLDDPEGDERHPLHRMRMRLRMFHLFMKVDAVPLDEWGDGRTREYVERVRAVFEKGGPDAARMPGIIWPLAAFFLGTAEDMRAAMDATVANCREYGGEWEIGVALMFRTHVVVDAPGGMAGVDDDLAELRVLSRRVGDRWMRAQVCSAAGEAAMARGRFDAARGEYAEALRLAFEVGAYAETPFLLARLGEVAYRSGDQVRALSLLDEASVAADRYGVIDSRAFVNMLRAQIALDDGRTELARELWREAREDSSRGTPPPQFMAALNWSDAMITAAESGPAHGLRKLRGAVREAVDERCADVVVAGLVEAAAAFLGRLDAHPAATRLMAAGTTWRGGLPRAARERAEAERTETAARASLGPERYESERAEGSGYTMAEAQSDLAEALREYPED